MKRLGLKVEVLTLVAMLWTFSATADIIYKHIVTVENWMYDNSYSEVLVDGSPQAATINNPDAPIPGGTVGSYSWDVEITDLNLNDSGSNDDSVTFTFNFEANGYINVGTDGDIWVGSSLIEGDDYLTLSGGSVVYEYDSGAEVKSGIFRGVSRLQLANIHPDNDIIINGENYDVLTNAQGGYRQVAIDPPLASAKMQSDGDNFSVVNWTVQTAIPEPTSGLLLALAAVTLLKGRSRRR